MWNYKSVLFVTVACLTIYQFSAINNVYSTKSASATPKAAEIKVLVSSQDAFGINEKDVVWSSFTKTLEEHTVERIKHKVRVRNPPSAEVEKYLENLTSEALHLETGGVNLALVRLSSKTTGEKSLMVYGFTGGQFKKIFCSSENIKEPISIVEGLCADKIREVFSVTF